MANIYVYSAGSNTSTYDTWAKAATTLLTAAGADAAGDSIYVASTHAEAAYGSTTTFSFAGTLAAPVKIIAGTTAAAPPTTIAAGVVISTGNGFGLKVAGSVYCYGLVLKAGSGSSSGGSVELATTAGVAQTFEACELWVNTTETSSASRLYAPVVSSGDGALVHLRNSSIKFGAVQQRICPLQGKFLWEGGGLVSGTAAITALFNLQGNGTVVEVSGVDLSAMASTAVLVEYGSASVATAIFRNCKLPASWTGSLLSGTIDSFANRIEMHNCDSGDTNYRVWVEDYAGSIVSDTGVYNDAGASDGTTRLSWKMVSSANAEFPAILLRSPEVAKWNDTTGSAITVTVEIVHSSQGSGTNGVLNDDECWLEVMYLGTSGAPLGSWITDCKADVLATAAAQTTSSAAWTGDSAGWDTQKLSVTFTPQEKGFVHARVVFAKASATVYVDPLLTVS